MRIVDSFEPHVPRPLDSRMQCANDTEMETLRRSDMSYPYMLCVNLSDGIMYYLSQGKTEWIKLVQLPLKTSTLTRTTDSNGKMYGVQTGYVLFADSVTTSVTETYTEVESVTKTVPVEADVSVTGVVGVESKTVTSSVTVNEITGQSVVTKSATGEFEWQGTTVPVDITFSTTEYTVAPVSKTVTSSVTVPKSGSVSTHISTTTDVSVDQVVEKTRTVNDTFVATPFRDGDVSSLIWRGSTGVLKNKQITFTIYYIEE